MGVTFAVTNTLISIHAPARGATQMEDFLTDVYKFQSTLPRGERHPSQQSSIRQSNFNPRSREGSDGWPTFPGSWNHTISIHAPARGATPSCCGSASSRVFQSTLPRGERPVPPPLLPRPDNFNPRSREGSDFASLSVIFPPINFNPRSREGSDINGFQPFCVVGIFQSTLPRGERRLTPGAIFLLFLFQSTLPRGERPDFSHLSQL